jgi:hypothetical protein
MASGAAPTPYPVQEAQRRTTMSHVKEPHRSTSLLLPQTSSLGLIPNGSTVPSRVQRPYGKPLIT